MRSNAVLSGAGHEPHRKRAAGSLRPPRTRSYVSSSLIGEKESVFDGNLFFFIEADDVNEILAALPDREIL